MIILEIFHASFEAVQAVVLFLLPPSAAGCRRVLLAVQCLQVLPDSVLEFPSQEEFSGMIAEAGFRNVHLHELTFGIATIYVGEKV